MRALNRINRLLHRHGDKVERAVDKAAVAVDKRTKGRHRSRIDHGSRTVKQALRRYGTAGPAPHRRGVV